MGEATRADTCSFRGRIPGPHQAALFDGVRMLRARVLLGSERQDEAGEDLARRVALDLLRQAREAHRETLAALPDLEHAVHERLIDCPPLCMDLRRFADALTYRAPRFQVDVCGIGDDGTVVVGAYSARHAGDVRPGDRVASGAVFTADLDRGTCHITARVTRLLCTNGQVLPLRALVRSPAYERHPSGQIDGSIEKTVRLAFSGKVLDRTLQGLTRAAETPVDDPVAFLRARGAALDGAAVPSVRRAFRRNHDRTAFGALNALAQTARDTVDLRHRYSLERMAGRMIPRFARGERPPTGRGSGSTEPRKLKPDEEPTRP